MLTQIISRFGFQLIKKTDTGLSKDMDERFGPIYTKTKEYSMTSPERMYAMYTSVQYISKCNINGAIVECGVWRGGSMMIAAFVLKDCHDTGRRLYLYDTYEGMSKPGIVDRGVNDDNPAMDVWLKNKKSDSKNNWCFASLDEVRNNMKSTGYPTHNIRYVKGKVENTIPSVIPNKIALLRLDTDWYSSTRHELLNLYPRLVHGGVLIIDDYGHWKGSRKAVDEYIRAHKFRLLLNRIDYGARLAIKL